MARSTWLLLLLIICTTSRGQEMDIDSLRARLHIAEHDTSYANTAYYLARNLYYEGELDSTRMYAAQAIDRLQRRSALTQRDLFWLTQLTRMRGMGWYSASRFDSAIVAFQEMYHYSQRAGITKDMGAALSYQGFALRGIDDPEGALAVVHRAVQVLSTLPYGPDIANAYHELGTIHADLGHTDSAIHWYARSIELYKVQGNDHHLATTLSNIGDAYHLAGRWHEADSVQLVTRGLLHTLTDPMAYNRWATGEARMLLRQGEHARATLLLDSAIAMASAMEDHNAAHHLLKVRALAHARAGRMNAAFADDDASVRAHDDDLDLEKVRATERARGEFEHAKNMAVAQAEADKQRAQKWAALAVGLLALLLALVWYRSYRAKSRANEAIQRTQVQLVQSEKQREAELVRTRIARDIHDEIGATLTKIRLLSDVAAQYDHSQFELTRHSLERIGDHARHVGQSMSDIVWAVDPGRDTHQGMLDHVRELSRRLLGDNGIDFSLDLSCGNPDQLMEPDLRRDLHLVINEAFNNILKYANAKHVSVHLKLNAGRFELGIADDGAGFSNGTVLGSGNGLRNMRDRIARHAGNLSVQSAPGDGTRLSADGTL